MAIFNNMAITTKGQALYAKAQAGTQLNFTKLQIGSGTIGTQNPATLVALINPKFDVGIQSITPNTELKTATIAGMINNSNVTDATYICEIGIFAQDPDEGEILYGYGSAGTYGDYMAPASQGAYSWNYEINAAIGNAANVTVQLSNLTYDYGMLNTNTTFAVLSGGNQKEINKSIDTQLSDLTNKEQVYTTTNSGNAYSVTVPNLTALIDGYPLTVKFNVASTGAITVNPNGLGAKSVVDYFGNPVTNVRDKLIANLRYEATNGNFILLGKGGGGNLTADKLLIGYSGTGDNEVVNGTMPNRAGDTVCIASSVSGTTLKLRASDGYRDGVDDNVTITDADFIASNILSGKNIFGLDGSATISSLGGKRFASGTVTSTGSGTYLTFNFSSTGTLAMQYVTVSGLSFKPSMIILKNANPTMSVIQMTTYDELAEYNYAKNAHVVGNTGANSSGGGANTDFRVDGGSAYVNASGFRLPVNSSNEVYSWIAYE